MVLLLDSHSAAIQYSKVDFLKSYFNPKLAEIAWNDSGPGMH
jgi:hypothetical protein